MILFKNTKNDFLTLILFKNPKNDFLNIIGEGTQYFFNHHFLLREFNSCNLFVFFQSWRRQESELALRWNSTQVERKEIVRPEFYGEIRQSPLTGKPERYYPTWKRVLIYLLSFVITLPFLGMAVGAMILSLNFNGYVKDKHSPIYLAALAKYSEPVRILLIVVNSCFAPFLHLLIVILFNCFN